MKLRHGQTNSIPDAEGQTIVSGICTLSHQPYSTKPLSYEGLEQWACGKDLIQHCLPHTSRDDREFLISGSSPNGWNGLFPREAPTSPTNGSTKLPFPELDYNGRQMKLEFDENYGSKVDFAGLLNLLLDNGFARIALEPGDSTRYELVLVLEVGGKQLLLSYKGRNVLVADNCTPSEFDSLSDNPWTHSLLCWFVRCIFIQLG
jgi:hypothetical protein